MDEYRRERESSTPFARSLEEEPSRTGRAFDPHAALGIRAEFGKPTDEDTRTWGNAANLTIATIALGHFDSVPTQQLIHVARRRPTSFNILTVITLGMGWTGETASNWVVNILYTIGVGQTQATFAVPVTIVSPANNTQIIQRDQFPANAINAYCVLSSTGSPALSGQKNLIISQFAAPVFE
jgi:hypothetical protein